MADSSHWCKSIIEEVQKPTQSNIPPPPPMPPQVRPPAGYEYLTNTAIGTPQSAVNPYSSYQYNPAIPANYSSMNYPYNAIQTPTVINN